MESTEAIHVTSRLRRLAAVWAIVLTSALATAGAAFAFGGSQVVGGVVQEQFGVGVTSDGTVTGNSSTIRVDVTRTVENGVQVITISPRD